MKWYINRKLNYILKNQHKKKSDFYPLKLLSLGHLKLGRTY